MKNICKINLALSDEPLYVAVNDVNMNLDSIFKEAISALKDGGRTHESQQLAALFKDHDIFTEGKLLSKGTLFKELPQTQNEVQGEAINLATVELLTVHTGGL